MKRLTKEERFTFIVTLCLSFLPLIVGLLLWNRLPDQLPGHFGFSGEPDRYDPKGTIVFGAGLFIPLLYLFTMFIMLNDPKNSNMSEKVMKLIMWTMPCVSLFLCITIYGYALGLKLDITVLSMILLGIMFIFIGNYLPKCRQSYTVGIRCSWTLNDPENWEKTHRFAGHVFVLCGLLMILVSPLARKIGPLILLIIIVAAGLPYIYSYDLYRKKINEG